MADEPCPTSLQPSTDAWARLDAGLIFLRARMRSALDPPPPIGAAIGSLPHAAFTPRESPPQSARRRLASRAWTTRPLAAGDPPAERASLCSNRRRPFLGHRVHSLLPPLSRAAPASFPLSPLHFRREHPPRATHIAAALFFACEPPPSDSPSSVHHSPILCARSFLSMTRRCTGRRSSGPTHSRAVRLLPRRATVSFTVDSPPRPSSSTIISAVSTTTTH